MNIPLNPFMKRHLLIFAFFVIILSAMFFFVIHPLATQAKDEKETFLKKQRELIMDQDQLAQIQKISKNSEEYGAIFNKVANLLPENPNTSDFIVDLENLSNSTGILVNNLAIAETKDASKSSLNKKQLPATKFSFDIDTNYQSLIDILKKLERFDRFNSIESINLLVHDEVISSKIKGSIFNGK